MKATLGSFRSEATYPHACSQHAHASEFSSLEYQRCLCCKLAGVEPKFRSRHCIEECAHVKLWIQGLGMARQRDGERATLDLLAAAIHHGGFIHLCRGAAFGKIPGTRFLIQSSISLSFQEDIWTDSSLLSRSQYLCQARQHLVEHGKCSESSVARGAPR